MSDMDNTKIEDVLIENIVNDIKVKEKIPATRNMQARVVAFVGFIIATIILVGSIAGIAVAMEADFYMTPKNIILENQLEDISCSDAQRILSYVYRDDKASADFYCQESNIASVVITEDNTNRVLYTYGKKNADAHTYEAHWNDYSYDDYYYYEDATEDIEESYPITVSITLKETLEYQDRYYFITNVLDVAYEMRYWIFLITFVSLGFMIFDFVFLMVAAGRRKEDNQVHEGIFTSIPTDVFTVLTAMFGAFICYMCLLLARESSSWEFELFSVIILLILCLCISLGWCMSIAVRAKLGTLWKSCWCYRIFRFCWRIFKKCCLGIVHAFQGIVILPKLVLVYCGISAVELFGLLIFCSYAGDGSILIPWFLEKIILFCVVMYYGLGMQKLFKAGENMANGNYIIKVNPKSLPHCMQTHGNHLNSVLDSMNQSVEARMKSERMKTDLITNVSHDIKTPLTSIINYADLISKEECDNPKIAEYSEVLYRQSDKLKSLINDLVEASKASSGNIEMTMEPTEVGVLLSQAIGEYETKFREKNLTLIAEQPEEAIAIMADGRRLWRVFDNLMNNICKYAQPGTRVYLTLERTEYLALITFKNTSAEPLNMSAEELMERFTRGDDSRHTEGNGLGLAIARSLAELQNGSLELAIDGDLFKAVLRFPVIK